MELRYSFVLAAVLLTWATGWRLESVRARQTLLLAASYLFYASWIGVSFLLVLIASSLMNHGLGSALRRRPTLERLWIGVGLNILLLVFFKYIPAGLGSEAENFWPELVRQIVMPVGISFWTFQGLSYLFDIYRDEEVDPTCLEFCLYMAFWPTVLSGPVCRLPNMLPQFRRAHLFNLEDVSLGLRRLILGILMKFVLGELLGAGLRPGEGVAAGFDSPTGAWAGLDVWLLAIGFGFQLFFDFAGYSHMVIGAARIFGIQLEENFARPYLATTPSVFWTRWHMSLSFWIRDYVFLPLATLKRERWWLYLGLFFSMTLFGLWHAATLTFLLWGAYHGLLLVFHRWAQTLKLRMTLSYLSGAKGVLSGVCTFSLISIGWILFRANDLHQVGTMVSAIFSPHRYFHTVLPASLYVVTVAILIVYLLYEASATAIARWRVRHAEREKLRGVGLVAVELVEICTTRTWWWLAPIGFVMAVVIAVVAVGEDSAIAPFVYTAF
jgi:alginate O-acetyltransferase complex protein AlgI